MRQGVITARILWSTWDNARGLGIGASLQATMTERYVHAAQVALPGAAERTEERLFAGIASDDEPTPQKEHACH